MARTAPTYKLRRADRSVHDGHHASSSAGRTAGVAGQVSKQSSDEVSRPPESKKGRTWMLGMECRSQRWSAEARADARALKPVCLRARQILPRRA
eukprot:1837017-Pleurochrysis_carterae.AAC.1